MTGDSAFLKKIANSIENETAKGKFVNAIKDLAKRLRAYFKSQGNDAQVRKLQKVEDAFAEFYDTATAKIAKETIENGETAVNNDRRSKKSYSSRKMGNRTGGITLGNWESNGTWNGKRRGRSLIQSFDSEGNKLSSDIAEILSDTRIIDAEGRPLAVYHGTDTSFSDFKYGDIGFHFGSLTQARNRIKNIPLKQQVVVRGYLNITNPVFIERDINGWTSAGTALALKIDGVLTTEEYKKIIDLFKQETKENKLFYDSDSSVLLRKILKSKGIDGIVYKNDIEENAGTSIVAFDNSQIIRTHDNYLEFQPDESNASLAKDDIRYSVKEIIGESGTNYGMGVYLDSALLDGLTEADRIRAVKARVKELGGNVFTAYDDNDNEVPVTIADHSRRFKNKNGKKVPVSRDLAQRKFHAKDVDENRIKQEAVVLADELITTSKYSGKESAKHPHGWLDDNGKNDFDVWTTYLEDRGGQIWKAYMKIANAVTGEKILYDVSKIEKVEQSRRLDTSPPEKNISQQSGDVNAESGKDDRKWSVKDTEGNTLSKEQQEYFKNSKVRDENGNLLVMYHGTRSQFTVFDRSMIGSSGAGAYEGAGFNFTPSETRAASYGTNAMKGYVRVNNPLSSKRITFTERQLADIISKIDPTGDDIISNYCKDTRDYGTQAFIKRESLVTAKAIMEFAENDVDIYSELSAGGGRENLIEAFSDMGYDGLIHYYNNGKIKTVVTFNSNQFKEIGNTNPTENDDIRWSVKVDKRDVDYLGDVLDMGQHRRFMSEIDTKPKKKFVKAADGDVIVPIDNMLVYTDFNKNDPGISQIIRFNTDDYTEISAVTDYLLMSEKGEFGIEQTRNNVKSVFGQGFIREYDNKMFGYAERYDRQSERGKRRSDAYHAEQQRKRARISIEAEDDGIKNSVRDVYGDTITPEESEAIADDIAKSLHASDKNRWTATRTNNGMANDAKKAKKEQKVRPLSDIIAKLGHDYGIQITSGHIRGKGTRGTYNKKNKGIRSRVANDLPTISHELGHAIDDRADLIA